jgi:hypothetical protein
VRIGIDLDGVCYDFALRLRRYLVEWLGHAPEPYQHLHSWDFWTRWGWDSERYLAACHEAVDAGCLFATGEPHQGTQEALTTLAAAGHELHIVTARNFGSAPGASERATIRWLEKYGIPYTSLTISHDGHVLEGATAPLRKCMAVVAGTPSSESPNAWAVTMWPSLVTAIMAALRWSVFMAFCTILAMAAACGDRDVVTWADFDAELVHAASETADRQSEIAIPSLTTLRYSHQNQE